MTDKEQTNGAQHLVPYSNSLEEFKEYLDIMDGVKDPSEAMKLYKESTVLLEHGTHDSLKEYVAIMTKLKEAASSPTGQSTLFQGDRAQMAKRIQDEFEAISPILEAYQNLDLAFIKRQLQSALELLAGGELYGGRFAPIGSRPSYAQRSQAQRILQKLYKQVEPYKPRILQLYANQETKLNSRTNVQLTNRHMKAHKGHICTLAAVINLYMEHCYGLEDLEQPQSDTGGPASASNGSGGQAPSRDTKRPHSALKQAEATLPAEAIKIFEKAIGAGLMECTTDGYKWLYGGNTGKARLAYFCRQTFNPDGCSPVPYKMLEQLFNVTRLDVALDQAMNAKRPQKWRGKIDELFNEQPK